LKTIWGGREGLTAKSITLSQTKKIRDLCGGLNEVKERYNGENIDQILTISIKNSLKILIILDAN
jgi:hypothetical protein